MSGIRVEAFSPPCEEDVEADDADTVPVSLRPFHRHPAATPPVDAADAAACAGCCLPIAEVLNHRVARRRCSR